SLYRLEQAKNASLLLNIQSPKTIEDVRDFTIKYEQVSFWDSYVPINNTFKELLSSGNLTLIKNDSIKNSLLQLDKLYSAISIYENHIRRDYEQLFYEVAFKNTSFGNFFDLNDPKNGFNKRLEIKDIPESSRGKLIADAKWIYNNQTMNNGLKLAVGNNILLTEIHGNVAKQINKLIKLIDEDIEK
ncbi:MAG: hypothetical protein ABI638_02970, partial [Ignavibacteriota bacterium]